MKKYLSLLRMRFIAGLQYRAAALAGIATQFAWGFMLILMFSAFYRSDASAFPMSLAQTASYIWLQQAFLALLMVWFLDSEIISSITNGNVAYELCRPIDLYAMWFFKNVAMRLAKAVLRCLPILVIALFLPAPYTLQLPGIGRMLLFFLSLLLGMAVTVAFCMLIYIYTFYTMSQQGLRMFVGPIIEFLSGSIIPLPFLPDGLYAALSYLPTASMLNTPFLIFNGVLAGSDLYKALALQVFWMAALILFGKITMQHALKRVIVQGG